MIKNSAAVVVAAALAACAKPGAPPGYQGVVELDERVLAFEVPGRVDTVAVRRGDMVKDGQPLAKLDETLEKLTRKARADEEAAARAEVALLKAGARAPDLASLAADVNAAAAAEDLAKKTLERMKTLHASGSVPQAELDRAQADVDRAVAQRRSLEQRLASLRQGARPQEIARAEAQAEAARSALDLEDARLARHELHAKNDGLVLDVHVEPGELVAIGTPAVTVADVMHPYSEVFVPEAELAGIRIGTKAEVHVDSAAASVPGEVEYVSPKTEFTPRYLFSDRERPNLVIRVRVRIDDRDRVLHAGVPAFVRFTR